MNSVKQDYSGMCPLIHYENKTEMNYLDVVVVS